MSELVLPFSYAQLLSGSIADTNATLLLLFAVALAIVYFGIRPRSTESKSVSFASAAPSKSLTPLAVYYGSQTGTAESFARQVAREAAENGFAAQTKCLAEVDELSQLAPLSVFVTSTFGEGECPDNAASFAAALQSADAGSLSITYCVFGLGNRQYECFNAAAILLDSELARAGADRVMEVGLGDDDSDLEGDFESWKELLWSTLQGIFASEAEDKATASVAIPDCPYTVEYFDEMPELVTETASDKAFECPVKSVRQLTPQSTSSAIEIEIDISQADGLTYQTADTLAVLPQNCDKIVKSVAESLNLNLDRIFALQSSEATSFAAPMTVRDCLTRYLDLTAAPRRADLKLIAAFAEDAEEQATLLRLASKDGKDEYRQTIVEEFVGLAELLQRFPSIDMPIEHLVNLCPKLQPRSYTISSSSSVHPDTVHLTVTVAQSLRKDGSVFKGVCSNYLADCQPGSIVRVYSRESTFRLPQDSRTPIIMVGPGTGIAPMHALLEERTYQKQTQEVGRNILYFGCRKAVDYLYREELATFAASGNLDELHVGYSREEPNKKVYVQDLLRENAAETYRLMEQEGAYIYVCGACKMGNDVTAALVDIVAAEGGHSADDAKQYVSNLTKTGRLVQELWA